MIALAVLPVLAVVVAAPAGGDEGCPSARQVTDAMTARFPAFVIAADQGATTTRPDVLRALLDVAADGTVVRFSLVDARGETQLRRALPASGRGRPSTDCQALADTVAAIVERYLGAISYDGQAPGTSDLAGVPLLGGAPVAGAATSPAVPRAAFVLVGLGWRMPAGGQRSTGEIEGRLGVELELTPSFPQLRALISLGAAPTISGADLDDRRTATVRRFPARLGASVKLAAGPGFLEPALALALDLLSFSSSAGTSRPASQTFRLGPGLEAAVGYRLKVAGTFHVRPRASFGVAFQRYDVEASDTPGQTVLATPRGYASFGIDTGVLFQ